MSREKRGSWRKGKVLWFGRLYIATEILETIEKMAKRDDREMSYIMSKALERGFIDELETKNG